MTGDQLDAAARKLCEIRVIDPDCFPGGWDTNFTLARQEIKHFLEIRDAIEFGIAAKPASQCDPNEFFGPGKPKPNGLPCPKCRSELFDSEPGIYLASLPPRYKVHCEQCGYSGFRL